MWVRPGLGGGMEEQWSGLVARCYSVGLVLLSSLIVG